VNAKFEVSTSICGEVIARSIFVAWELVSSLKTAKGVILERVSTSYLFQRIKSPIFPNFHAGIIICIIFVLSSLTIDTFLRLSIDDFDTFSIVSPITIDGNSYITKWLIVMYLKNTGRSSFAGKLVLRREVCLLTPRRRAFARNVDFPL
jgi:hypothetical protein